MSDISVWAARHQRGIVQIRRGHSPVRVEQAPSPDGEPYAKRAEHKADEAGQHSRVEGIQRNRTTCGCNLPPHHYRGEEPQAYGHLAPPYPSAAGVSLHGKAQQGPAPDESEP